MQFLTPGWFFLSLLSLPILLLYMLRLRRREVKISSTMLWEAILRDRQANTPWQRLRKNILLILQLIILISLVLALARPGLRVPAVATGSVVVLLDASASMAATDVVPNRFEAALTAIGNLIDNLDRNSKMTIIQVARQSRVLAAGESDHNNLRESLLAASVSVEEANWQTAFALAASAVSIIPGGKATIVIVTDGGLPGKGLPPLPGEIRYIPIGSSSSNLAISAFAIRPAGERNELFISITNYGEIDQEAILSIYLDDQLINAQQLLVKAGDKTNTSLSNFPSSIGIAKATLNPTNESPAVNDWDFLDLDNTAFTINYVSTNRRILLVSPGNFFLEQILGSFQELQAYRALPETSDQNMDGIRFRLPDESFDLYILDEALPSTGGVGIPELPDGNMLLINPPSNPLFPVTGVFTPGSNYSVKEHLLTQYLDWRSVHIREARFIQTPIWAEVLVESPDGPLVLAGETGGRRIVILTFDLNDSDLPLQIAFPILFANIIEYLAPNTGVNLETILLPGDGIDIRVPSSVETVAIASPNGKIYALSPTDSGFFFPYTNELGVYAINYINNDTAQADYFSVNLFSSQESSIEPKQEIQVGSTTIGARTQNEIGLRELWFLLILAGLIILVIEWWVYHRRLVLPSYLKLTKLNVTRLWSKN